jgi:AcrR family transcriptional regulator
MARYQAGIRTEARIIDATRELLGEVGLEGTTLKAICDRAGVRAGSFYNIFDSKEEAIMRVVGDAIASVDPDPQGAGTDTVGELIKAYARFITGQSTVARIYLQTVVSGGLTDNDLAKRFLRHHERRVARFADAIRRADPEIGVAEAGEDAELLLAALNGLAFHWMLQPAFDFTGHIRRIIDAHEWLRHRR